jgi:hypothetical protein
MTLDEMINQCVIYTQTQKTVIKTGLVYTGKALDTVNRFITAINYAKGKIAREKFAPVYTEQITLDNNLRFPISSLSKTFIKVEELYYKSRTQAYWEVDDWYIYCPDNSAGDILNIQYSYIPSDLVNLTDVLDFPAGVIDPKILCYYAVYEYWLVEGSTEDLNKSDSYLSMWNDGYSMIRKTIGKPKQVKSTYNMG